ncbi:MAG: hypothetical protein Q9170_001711 [Blastenia crenularia]
MTQPLIYINSWPGVGKHTIAQALAVLLGPNTRVIQIHNHLHIDLAEAILPRTSADYQDLRLGLREVFLRALIESKDTWDHIYILTDFQTSNPLGGTVAEEYRSAALARDCTFIPIILDCDVDENARRMMSAERTQKVAQEGKGMLVDEGLLREMRGRGQIYEFGSPEEVVVDVSRMEVGEAADVIAGHVRRVVQGEVGEEESG